MKGQFNFKFMSAVHFGINHVAIYNPNLIYFVEKS